MQDKSNSLKNMTLLLGDLDSSLGYLLRRANLLVRSTTIPVLAKHGLSPTELTVLYVCYLNPNCSQRDLAEATTVEPPIMQRLIIALEGKGLIQRKKSTIDRRVTLIILTPQGEQKVVEAVGPIREIERSIANELSEEEYAVLLKLLRVICCFSKVCSTKI